MKPKSQPNAPPKAEGPMVLDGFDMMRHVSLGHQQRCCGTGRWSDKRLRRGGKKGRQLAKGIIRSYEGEIK